MSENGKAQVESPASGDEISGEECVRRINAVLIECGFVLETTLVVSESGIFPQLRIRRSPRQEPVEAASTE